MSYARCRHTTRARDRPRTRCGPLPTRPSFIERGVDRGLGRCRASAPRILGMVAVFLAGAASRGVPPRGEDHAEPA